MSLNQQCRQYRSQESDKIVPLPPARLELVPELATSEFEKAELHRTSNELQYRKLYEQLPSIYLTLDITGIILSVNQYGAELLGCSQAELLNKSVIQLFAVSEQHRLANALISLFKTSAGNVGSWELRLNCPNSKIAWVKVIARILPGDEENPVVLMVCEDITAYQDEQHLDTSVSRFTLSEDFANHIDVTERKSLEVSLCESDTVKAQILEMERLNFLKDEFLSTVSHELRTPLTNIKMAIQMLGITLNLPENVSGQSKASRYFQILNNECDRQINLINNFLDLQKLDTNVKPLVLETILAQDWVVRVVELFQARNRNVKQRLNINVAPNLPPFICDPFSLERIFIELLTNACKFSPVDAEVTVTAKATSHHIEFEVANTGVEIPSTELPLIFNKFYRIPSNDPWKQGGTGLGLALVQKLTKYLGGAIAAESSSNCTRFTIQLPVKEEGE